MKSTGIVRNIDRLGRITLPMELRCTMRISEHDPIEVYTDGDRIVLQKYIPGCALCGSADVIGAIGGKAICRTCAKRIKEVLDAK